ncbi:uncharacterized protein LOC135161174 isoform X4 [Diachasmimorpha longicaudata]
MTASTIKTWLTRGEFEKLEHYVLEGKGSRLLNEHSPDLRTRVFLKGLPTYLSKISQAHEAVTRGVLAELQRIVGDEPKKKLAIAKDAAGIPLLHKAVYHDHQEVVEWILDNYPNTAGQKDREGRTALHYCVACKDPESIWDLLIEGGCDASVCDKRGHPAAYYLEHASEIELPDPEAMATKPGTAKSENLDFKPSNIRIWIHNRDITKLQQVLWEGHGSKLKCEISNNPRVRRFLEATPFIMGTIKQMHSAVVKNDIDEFLEKIADPVSPVILCSKDMNGLNVLHKAAGFGYLDIAREILERYPAAVLAQDNDGKTPLHYGAAVRDGGAMYELLTEYGADESKLDNKNKAAAFYKNRPGDIDLTNLVVVPEAPRVSGTKYPKHWDWRILENDGMSLRALKKLDAQVDADSAFGSAESALKSAESSDNVFGMTDEEGLKDDLVGQDEQPDEKENGDADDEGGGDEAGGDENDGAEVEGEETAVDDEEAAADDEETGADEDGEAPADEEEVGADDEEAEAAADEEEAPPDGEEEAAPDEGEDPPDEAAAPDEEQDETAADPDDGDDDAEVEAGDGDEENDDDKPDDADSGNVEEPPDENQEEEKNEPSTGDSGVDESRVDDDQVIAGEHEEVIEADLNDPDSLDDPEIDDLLVNGNMEQLASVVLNGEGRRLVNRQSSNPELQAFIDNVPSYIGKIHAVHIAAKEGNLKDLQNSLDRRKFAIARDGASPHGATPLHVAVIFGHTSVIRYLAGRFPETAQAVDIDGRTPLHYAATLADNGHYYNLLLHLGANPLTLDNFGQKADYYKENQSDLSHKQLLRDFGAREELADEMLTDKEDSNMETPIFREEEGRYLASSVGDPLIKGLAKVAQSRPKDPLTYLATYLYNFARRKSEASIQKSDILIVPDRPEEQVDTDSSSTPMEDPNNTPDDEGYMRSPVSDIPESAFAPTNRDEHGQSMLHFAAVRSRPKDGLFHILQETQINVGYRDELYRTARDVAEESNFHDNVMGIDRFVVYLAARGETEKLVELLLEGYDHILDTEDGGVNIVDITAERNHDATIQFLQGIPTYLGQREEVHRAIRGGDLGATKEILSRYGGGGTLLAVGKNTVGRCSIHIAVLCEHVDIVRYLANTYPETLRIGDNLNRTALHYAMGVHQVEALSGILIKAGAKRVQKDLKSRQPTYYFMNKSDIQRLQEEEKTMVK